MEFFTNTEAVMVLAVVFFLGAIIGMHLGEWSQRTRAEAWRNFERRTNYSEEDESESEDPSLSNVILKALTEGKKVRPKSWKEGYIYLDDDGELVTDKNDGTYPWAGLPTCEQAFGWEIL